MPLQPSRFPFKTAQSEHESEQLLWLRNNSSYLGFSKLEKQVDAAIVFIRGVIGNLVMLSGFLLFFAILIAIFHPFVMLQPLELTGGMTVVSVLVLLVYFAIYRYRDGAPNTGSSTWVKSVRRFLPLALAVVFGIESSVYLLEWVREIEFFRHLGFRECVTIVVGCAGAITAVPKSLPSGTRIPNWVILALLHSLTIAMLGFVMLRVQNYAVYGAPPQYWRLDYLFAFIVLTAFMCSLANISSLNARFPRLGVLFAILLLILGVLVGGIATQLISKRADIESESLLIFTHPAAKLADGLAQSGLLDAQNDLSKTLQTAQLLASDANTVLQALVEAKRRLDVAPSGYEEPFDRSLLFPHYGNAIGWGYDFKTNPTYYSEAIRFYEQCSRLSKLDVVDQVIVRDHLYIGAMRSLLDDVNRVANQDRAQRYNCLLFSAALNLELQNRKRKTAELTIEELTNRLRALGLDEVGNSAAKHYLGIENKSRTDQSTTQSAGAGTRPFAEDAQLDNRLTTIYPSIVELGALVETWLAGKRSDYASIRLPVEDGQFAEFNIEELNLCDLICAALKVNDLLPRCESVLQDYESQRNFTDILDWLTRSRVLAENEIRQANGELVDPKLALFLLAIVASRDHDERKAAQRGKIDFIRFVIQNCLKANVPLQRNVKLASEVDPKSFQLQVYRQKRGEMLADFEKDRLVALSITDYSSSGGRRMIRQSVYGPYSQISIIRGIVPHAIAQTYRSKLCFVAVYMICLLLVGICVLNPNATSLHGYYRDQLEQTFIKVDTQPKLSDFAQYSKGSTAPYHLINTTLNLRNGKLRDLRERNGDFFVFSPHYVGSKHTGYVLTTEFEEMTPHFTASSAMAISAAAAAPNMGRYTSGFATLLLSLLNLRLGVWLPNPKLGSKVITNREDIFREERMLLDARRRNLNDDLLRNIKTRTTDNQLIGLAFSGGGIRSASVNLGLAQALDSQGVFTLVDLMSTVSGGGYIGTCISNLMRDGNTNAATSESASGVEPLAASEEHRPSMGLKSKIRYKAPNIWRFLCELFGWLSHESDFIYLTDGGHIENLGVIPLLERRCKLIICGDAEADPNNRFDGLSQLLRLAEIDLGIRIRFRREDLAALSSTKKDVAQQFATQDRYFAVAQIEYPPLREGEEQEIGHFVYCKTGFLGNEDQIIQSYKQAHPSFPHESTGDQFFDEGQFEAYRRLGFQMGMSLYTMILPNENAVIAEIDRTKVISSVANHIPLKTL